MGARSVETASTKPAANATAASQPHQSLEACARSRWIAAAVAIGLALLYAAPFGSLNEATYLLDPLHRAFPELFARDWFVAETPPYMPVFGWLAHWLFVIDHDGAVAVLAAHLVVVLATYAAIYWLVSSLSAGWRGFALVAAFVTVTMGLSIGGSYLLPGYLQPSALATLGWIVAIAAFARDRFITCGIAAAAAGALHPNFLVLGIGLFTLAGFACRLGIRDVARLLVPQLVVLVCFLPQLLEAAGPSERAIWILSVVHAPVHYSPTRQLATIPYVLCWQLAAYGAMFVLCDVRPARMLWRFSLVASAVACTSALLVQLEPLRFLVQLFASRVAPFAQLACLALVAGALVRQATAPRQLAWLPRTVFALGLVVGVSLYGAFIQRLFAPAAIAAACCGCLVIALAPARVARVTLATLAALAVAYAVWARPPGRGITTRPYGSDNELALENWARTRTATAALFLIPPELGRFRLLARRAVVIDTKSPPLRPDLLEHWYERLCAAVLVRPGPSAHDLERRYLQLTAAELEQSAHAFGADYIVTDGKVRFPYPPVFHTSQYEVYQSR